MKILLNILDFISFALLCYYLCIALVSLFEYSGLSIVVAINTLTNMLIVRMKQDDEFRWL